MIPSPYWKGCEKLFSSLASQIGVIKGKIDVVENVKMIK